MPRPSDPIEEIRAHFERAKETEAGDPTAMSLATADAQGRPSARMVLLKQIDPRGFVFFTNYASRKARQLEENPYAALCIHWPSLALQVRAEGPVARISDEESDAYFATRGRASQIGAWASRQSSALDSRARLVARVAKNEARFAGRAVPRPPFWGGFRLAPERIELWWNRANRLHERRLYLREGDGWTSSLLYP